MQWSPEGELEVDPKAAKQEQQKASICGFVMCQMQRMRGKWGQNLERVSEETGSL